MNVGCCKHNWSSTEQIHVPCTSSLASDVPIDELYLCIRGQLCAWAWKHIVLLPCMCIRVEVGTVDEHGYNSQQKHIICDTCTTQFKLNDASFSSNLTDLLCLQVYQVPTCRSHDLAILLWKMTTTRQNRLHVLTSCTCSQGNMHTGSPLPPLPPPTHTPSRQQCMYKILPVKSSWIGDHWLSTKYMY